MLSSTVVALQWCYYTVVCSQTRLREASGRWTGSISIRDSSWRRWWRYVPVPCCSLSCCRYGSLPAGFCARARGECVCERVRACVSLCRCQALSLQRCKVKKEGVPSNLNCGEWWICISVTCANEGEFENDRCWTEILTWDLSRSGTLLATRLQVLKRLWGRRSGVDRKLGMKVP